MALSRRQFIRYATGAGLGLGLSGTSLLGRERSPIDAIVRRASFSAGRAGQPLRMLPTHTDWRIIAGVKEQQVWTDAMTEVWTLGDNYPSPIIRARSGDKFSLRLVNNLTEHTNIHWHGLIVPPDMDGHPKDVLPPGKAYDYSFTVGQRAGTYWYHPHPHMATAKQVYKGMAGFFIVTDDEEESFGLPSGAHDIPLLIQDRRTEPDRAFTYLDAGHGGEPGAEEIDGHLGDEILVNGTPEPYLEVGAGLYRFRMLNASNARIFDLALADGKKFHVIGTDGGLLDKPYETGAVFLAPGERVEILIDFSSYAVGQSVMMKSLGFSGETGRKQGAEMPVLRFEIARAADTQYQFPTALATIEKLDPTLAARTRTFILRIDHTTIPEGHTINDKTFDIARIDEEVELGDIEVWTFRNISFLHHPMHMHGAQFQVIDRPSAPTLEGRDRGWKDTVYLRPFETVHLAVRFAPWVGKFLLHCHNLEHEDAGMMLNYAVVAKSSAPGIYAMPTRMDLR